MPLLDDRRLRIPTAEDEPAIVALNETNVIETSALTIAKLQSMLRAAFYARVAGEPGKVDAFLIAFDERATYESPNFAWFRAHYPRFVYIDRIVVAERARRRGLGGIFYHDLIAAARDGKHRVVCCEVNVDPPNPGSDAFHDALGFSEIGSATLGNGKTVRYLAHTLVA